MDSEDHKMTATSTGHEYHGVYHCHRCGWPFPNAHPSARHRRAHKKVCGTIEGYKVILSEEHPEGHHLAGSDEENASDGDEHTPPAELEKKKSEDVFSDAVTDFPDSGRSLHLEERFESFKSVGGDLYENNDGIEKLNDPTKIVVPVTDTSAEAVSGVVTNGIQPDHIKSKTPGDMVEQVKEDILKEEDKSASVTVNYEEGIISDLPLTAVGNKEELCDKLVSEVAKDEALQNLDASSEVKSVAHSSEMSTSAENVGEIPLADEISKNVGATVVLEKVYDTTENTLPDESPLSNTSGSMQIPNDQKDRGENDGEKCVVESKDISSVEMVSEENTHAVEDDQTAIALKKDVDYCEENSNSNDYAGTEKEKGEGAFVEKQVIDYKLPAAQILEELSKNNSTVDESSGQDAELNHDKHSPPMATCQAPVPPLISETPAEQPISKETTSVISETIPEQPILREPASLISETTPEQPISKEPTSQISETTPEQPILKEPTSRIPETTPEQPILKEPTSRIPESTPEQPISKEPTSLISETTPELPISKEPTSVLTDTEALSKDSANDNSCIGGVAEINHDGNAVMLSEKSKNPSVSVPEALSTDKSLSEATPDFEETPSSEDVRELACGSEIVASDKSSKTPVPSSDFQDLHETVATCDDKNIINVEPVAAVDSKSLQLENDGQMTKHADGVSATDLSGSSISRSDSLEANCGSVSALSSQSNLAVAETNSQSDALETNSQKCKTSTDDKSDAFEPPSFMTLVQPGGGNSNQAPAATEIEAVHHNQHQPKSDALQAGWFPSLTNVVNESQGRKKNEEIIAKVTNWSPVKQQHSPLKSLLNEVKSPNTKQVPEADHKDENESKDNGAPAPKIQDNNTHKDMEEWNSPARYPIEIKKEKKRKGKSYWVPFVCCSSVHRDL